MTHCEKEGEKDSAHKMGRGYRKKEGKRMLFTVDNMTVFRVRGFFALGTIRRGKKTFLHEISIKEEWRRGKRGASDPYFNTSDLLFWEMMRRRVRFLWQGVTIQIAPRKCDFQ